MNPENSSVSLNDKDMYIHVYSYTYFLSQSITVNVYIPPKLVPLADGGFLLLSLLANSIILIYYYHLVCSNNLRFLHPNSDPLTDGNTKLFL